MPPTGNGSVYTTDEGTRVEENGFGTKIVWQDRPRSETGGELIGDTPLSILRDSVLPRLRRLNHAPETPSRETSLAITKVEEAVMWLEQREKRRSDAGILGTRTADIGSPVSDGDISRALGQT